MCASVGADTDVVVTDGATLLFVGSGATFAVVSDSPAGGGGGLVDMAREIGV